MQNSDAFTWFKYIERRKKEIENHTRRHESTENHEQVSDKHRMLVTEKIKKWARNEVEMGKIKTACSNTKIFVHEKNTQTTHFINMSQYIKFLMPDR